MSDPIWTKVHELLEGYPPEFNAQAAYDLVRTAWKMGLDVVRQPEGSTLYQDAMRAQLEELIQAKEIERGSPFLLGNVQAKT